MGGPSGGSIFSPVLGVAQNAGAESISRQSVDLQAQTRRDILSANIDDAMREKLLAQIDSIGAVPTQTRLENLKPIVDTLNYKKSLSEQVAKAYQQAVADASKLQSTVITSGKAAAVVPSGNSSIITGGY